MWVKISKEMGMPWRAVEAMHWQLGEGEMTRRAGVKPFSVGFLALDESLNKTDLETLGEGQTPSHSDLLALQGETE